MDKELLLQSDTTDDNEKLQRSHIQKGWKASCVYYLKQITVEPTMFLYMMAFMLTSVVEQAFFVHKACRVNLNFSEEICDNLTYFKEHNKQVQVVVSTFLQYNDIASFVIPIFLALFIGAWSDRRGRKLLLLVGLIGKLYYSVLIIINSIKEEWTVNTILWTASLPSGLTGADLSIFTAVFSYISDITSSSNRTARITILDVVYLTSMPIGVALGKYFFSFFNHSYTIMFGINASLMMISIIYSFFRLDWSTNSSQRPLKLCCLNASKKLFEEDEDEANRRKEPNCFLDFFNKNYLIESVQTIVKKRPNYGRIYIIALILSLGLYTFQRDERHMSYLYTNLKFDWDVNSFSNFRVFQSSIYVVGTFFCIPFMGRYLELSDTTMVFIGTCGHSIARIVFALAEKSWLFYLGTSFACVGPVVAPVLRSMASKIVPENERGIIFSVLSVADTTVPLFSGVIYSQVYNATLSTYPSAIFWVTVATQIIVFAISLVIRITSRNKPLSICAVES